MQEGSDDFSPGPPAGSELKYVIRAHPADEPTADRAACSVKYVSFGSSLVVWGSTASGRTCHISIAATDHIQSQPGNGDQPASDAASGQVLSAKDVSGLVMRLKDGFIHPILIALCAEEGREPPPSLQLLPTELKLLCLHHLQVRPSWSCICNPATLLRYLLCVGSHKYASKSLVKATLAFRSQRKKPCCLFPCWMSYLDALIHQEAP